MELACIAMTIIVTGQEDNEDAEEEERASED